MMSRAAISQRASDGSAAISTAPSATNICDQKSPCARVRQAFSISARNGSRRWPQPMKSECEIDASSILETAETLIFFGTSLLTITNAPPPSKAYQRRKSAGALTTPTTTCSVPSACFSINPMRVAQVGTPRRKFLVPSIGSITQ